MNVLIDAKSFLVLNKLLGATEYLTPGVLAKELNISKRSVYYAISRINDFLLNAGIGQIEVERRLGILLYENHKQEIRVSLEQTVEADVYLLSPMERVRFMICYLIYNHNHVFVEELASRLEVSRNTVFNDFKVVESKLIRYNLKLVFNKRSGYQIEGNVINKRAIFLYNFQMIQHLYQDGIISFTTRKPASMYFYLLKKIEESLHVKYFNETLYALSVLIESYVNHQEAITISDLDIDEIMSTKEYQLVKTYFSMLSSSEVYYLTLHLLGGRLQVVPIYNKSSMYDREVYQIARDLKTEFERLACIVFEHDDELLEALYIHLKTSMFRYKYGIMIENPLTDDIMHNYAELFDLVKRASDYLQKRIGIPLADSEIAYLTLHFGSFLKRNVQHLRMVIICPNGVATGNMLRREIMQLVPDAQIDVQASGHLLQETNKYNLVISTVPMECDLPVIVVHPILSDHDKTMILQRVARYTNKLSNPVTPEEIFQQLKGFVQPAELDKFRSAVYSCFHQKHDVEFSKRKYGLVELLSEDKITYLDTSDWQTSVHQAAAPLLTQGLINDAYIESMIEMIHFYGPYNFIAEGVVLLHAKPIDGVTQLGVAMGISPQGISYDEQHRKVAHIVMVLAMEDDEKHLSVLKDLAEVFSVQLNMELVSQMTTPEQIMEFINREITN